MALALCLKRFAATPVLRAPPDDGAEPGLYFIYFNNIQQKNRRGHTTNKWGLAGLEDKNAAYMQYNLFITSVYGIPFIFIITLRFSF